MEEFYVTFGQQYGREGDPPHPRLGAHGHRDGWVTIVAADEDTARALVAEVLGDAYSNLHPAEHMPGPERLLWYPRGELLRITHPTSVAAAVDETAPDLRAERDDLYSRLACVQETTGWDRPYDERLDAIRGLCDLTTNGLAPKNAGAPARILTGRLEHLGPTDDQVMVTLWGDGSAEVATREGALAVWSKPSTLTNQPTGATE